MVASQTCRKKLALLLLLGTDPIPIALTALLGMSPGCQALMSGLVCCCALLPLFISSHRNKGFDPVWGLPSTPCCGCRSGACRSCTKVFSLGRSRTPLDTAKAASAFLPGRCCCLHSCPLLPSLASSLPVCCLSEDLALRLSWLRFLLFSH